MIEELYETLLRRQGLTRDKDGKVVPFAGMKTWSPPALTEQQQKEQDEYVRVNNLPF